MGAVKEEGGGKGGGALKRFPLGRDCSIGERSITPP